MGNARPPLDEALAILEQLKRDVPAGRLAELGDNPIVLATLENHLEKLRQSLEGLKGFYSSKSLKDSNPYYQAIRITRKAQKFARDIHGREATRENNDTIQGYLRELEEVFLDLSDARMEVISGEVSKDLILPPATLTRQDPGAMVVPVPSSKLLTPVALAQPPTRTKKFLAFLSAMATLPKFIGRFVLDLIGRHQSAESSSMIMGWIITVIVVAGVLGVVQWDDLSAKLAEWRLFFFPAK